MPAQRTSPSTRRTTAGLLVALVAGILCVAMRASGESGGAATFRFAPPDGLEFTVDTKTTKTQAMAGAGAQTDVIQTSARCKVERTEDGYRIEQETISGSMTRGGAPVDDPILSEMKGSTVTYDVDDQGRLRAIHGLKEIIDRMAEQLSQRLPGGGAGAGLSALTQAALAKEKAEWDGRVTSFVGRSARPGTSWKATVPFETPVGGSFPVSGVTRVVGVKRIGETDYVRVTYSMSARPGALAKQISQWIGRMVRAAGAPAGQVPKILAAEVAGGGERLVDPATLLVLSESMGRTIRMTMSLPGRGKVQVSMKERRTYRYRYGAAPTPAAPQPGKALDQ